MHKVAVVGGGLGIAIAYPQAKALHERGAEVDLIVGFRNKDLIILEEEMKDACTELIIMTDDGSNGHKGFVHYRAGGKDQGRRKVRCRHRHRPAADDARCRGIDQAHTASRPS